MAPDHSLLLQQEEELQGVVSGDPAGPKGGGVLKGSESNSALQCFCKRQNSRRGSRGPVAFFGPSGGSVRSKGLNVSQGSGPWSGEQLCAAIVQIQVRRSGWVSEPSRVGDN